MTVLLPALLLAIAVVFFVLHPVISGQSAPMDREDEELTEAQHRKRTALFALRDVEYDYLAGKLDDADYRKLKQEIAAEAFAAIDAEEAEWAAREGARRAAGGPTGPALVEGSGGVEEEIAQLRASIRDGMVCPHCGHPNAQGSRFCGDCGAALPLARRAAGDK